MRHEDLQMIDKMNFFRKTTDFSLIATTDFELDEDSNGFFLVFVIFFIFKHFVLLYFAKKCTDNVDCSLTSVKKVALFLFYAILWHIENVGTF